MAANSFGNIFRITTWGESHGPKVGVTIDGCPANIKVDETLINIELDKRSPGKSPFTSPRREKDKAQIVSGVFEGVTTGTPISILIDNVDADSSKYEPVKELLRPGHANFTYLEKYGVFDWRGGGRSSARHTAATVAAGAIAKQLLKQFDIDILAFITQIGDISCSPDLSSFEQIREKTATSPIFCPDVNAEKKMIEALNFVKENGDSLGGVVTFITKNVPVGLGDPIFEKLEAKLAHAMLSIPATKGFEIGEGFSAAKMMGSEHNDSFAVKNEKIITEKNHAGGVLGGITTGAPIVGRVAFKPTSSIKREQKTVDLNGKDKMFKLPDGSRHDPCVAIRGTMVVESMLALVLADLLLMNRGAKLWK